MLFQMHFSALNTTQLYDLIRLRAAVFVVEQNCVYQDVDGLDPNCHHILCYENRVLVACARIVPPKNGFAAIGRVAVGAAFRGTGLGKKLMEFAIAETHKLYQLQNIKIHAQCYLERFYADLGFVRVGADFLEDDIPHLRMELRAAVK